eukprot:832319-Rhodomonas_salina.3
MRRRIGGRWYQRWKRSRMPSRLCPMSQKDTAVIEAHTVAGCVSTESQSLAPQARRQMPYLATSVPYPAIMISVPGIA